VQATAQDQRAIRAGGKSTTVVVPVTFDLSLTDANAPNADPRKPATPPTGTATLRIPNELVELAPPGPVQNDPDAAVVSRIEHHGPEAVTVDDPKQAFDRVARLLPPSVVKIGAPGRTALQDFLSPTTIRDNFGAMLNGWVTSPNLVSPNASYAGAVQMKATPTDVRLIGTNSGAQLRLHDIATTNTGVTANTKSGVDVTASVGFGANPPVGVTGSIAAVGGIGAKVTETSNTGTNVGNRAGVQVKSDIGLYEVKADLEVRTANGKVDRIPVTTYVRVGLPEAQLQKLPTPEGSADFKAGSPDTRVAPPYLGAALAAGNVKVGEFAPAHRVQQQVESQLRKVPELAGILPEWDERAGTPVRGKGPKNFADVVAQLENQRKLDAELSPTALRARLDSLVGPGVDVQLKHRGRFTNDFVNINVKAKLTGGTHLGQVDDHNVRGWSGSGPRLDSSTTTQKGWNAGVEGKLGGKSDVGAATLTPTGAVGVKRSSNTAVRTTAGPAVNSSGLNAGGANAQVFDYRVEFEVEITRFSRNRAWVKRITPGMPQLQVPVPQVVARTGPPPAVNPTGIGRIDDISGTVQLWASDSSTIDKSRLTPERAAELRPKDPVVVPDVTPPASLRDWLTDAPGKAAPEILHVEALTNAHAVKQQAIEVLDRAAGGDSSLTVPGTPARNQIDRMFSPEAMKANLTRMVETGVQEGGLKYGRRINDRTGAIGVKVELGTPELVAVADRTSTENTTSGGFRTGDNRVGGVSWEAQAGVTVPAKPVANATGQGGIGVVAKKTLWSKSEASGAEVAGNVDRVKNTPSGVRTVLLRFNPTVTVVAESRAGNTAHKGAPSTAAGAVHLPGGLFARVSEQTAIELGALADPSAT
ncbi:hypothetical protein J7S33_19195, partial [Saccharothrix algeriensis]